MGYTNWSCTQSCGNVNASVVLKPLVVTVKIHALVFLIRYLRHHMSRLTTTDSRYKGFSLFTTCFAVLLSMFVNSIANGDLIDSLVGDRDGYNGTYDPDSVSFPLPFDFSTVATGADTAFTDTNIFTEGSAVTYLHQFSIPSNFVISSAVYEIVTFDNASEALGLNPSENGRIVIDGIEVTRGNNQDFFYDAIGDFFLGDMGLSSDLGAAEIFSADIPASLYPQLLDGQALVEYQSDSTTDVVAVDYSRILITVNAVPEPSSLFLLCTVLGVFALGRYRGDFYLQLR